MLGADYESPMVPGEELKSPLRRGVTSNWKMWPSGSCPRAVGERVVPSTVGGAVGLPGLL